MSKKNAPKIFGIQLKPASDFPTPLFRTTVSMLVGYVIGAITIYQLLK